MNEFDNSEFLFLSVKKLFKIHTPCWLIL